MEFTGVHVPSNTSGGNNMKHTRRVLSVLLLNWKCYCYGHLKRILPQYIHSWKVPKSYAEKYSTIHVTPYSTPALNQNTIYHIGLCPHSVVSTSWQERYNKLYNPMQIANRIANTKFDCGMATSVMPVFTQFLFPPSVPSFLPPLILFSSNQVWLFVWMTWEIQ